MTMKSVGEAANDMVRECNRQFPLIMEGQPPEYANCVAISTEASLREMLGPGALVILSPIIFGFALGKSHLGELFSWSARGVQECFGAYQAPGKDGHGAFELECAGRPFSIYFSFTIQLCHCFSSMAPGQTGCAIGAP